MKAIAFDRVRSFGATNLGVTASMSFPTRARNTTAVGRFERRERISPCRMVAASFEWKEPQV
jgi:hypothetical protein